MFGDCMYLDRESVDFPLDFKKDEKQDCNLKKMCYTEVHGWLAICFGIAHFYDVMILGCHIQICL